MDLLSSALEPLEPLYCLHPLLSGLVYRPGAFGSHLDQAIIDQEQIRYQLQGGGAGLALVQSWAKTIAYQRSNGRNILKLVIDAHG